MTDVRRKVSMSQVLADIKPYITKKFMAVPCIKEQDIQAICQILLPRYKNVQLMQGLANNEYYGPFCSSKPELEQHHSG